MRIGLVVSTFPPYQGGMGNMAFSYAQGLTRRGHQVEVFCPKRGGIAGGHDVPDASLDTPAVPFPVHRLKPWFDIRNSAFVPQLALRLGRFDAVNLHYPFYGGAEAVFLLKKLKRKKLPLIVNFQMDKFGAGAAGMIFKANARLFTPRLLRAADKVIVTSADYAAHSSAAETFWKYPAKFEAIPPGVDTIRFSPAEKDPALLKRYGIAAGEKVVLFVGGLDQAHAFKGVNFLLRAWRELGADKVRLLIVGQGDLRESYRRTADALGLGRSVVFADPVGAGELPAHYRLADLLVLPSTDSSEAFGIVLVEAMACGVPVLASDLPGVRSVVEAGRNGFVFRTRETKDLLDKLRAILINEDLRGRMRAGARETAVARYDREKIWDRVDKVFREAAPV
jgi:glycosyltransferase involved in cell wall biosynthesis